MQPPKQVLDLIAEFKASGAATSAQFKEDWVRSDYIEPLFEALGWKRLNPLRLTTRADGFIREVSQLVVGSDTKKAPDYGFYISGGLAFFVEAKKPSVSIKTAKDAAYQLRRYGWSAGHFVGVLTDFHEFAVYDCRIQPDPADSASVAQIEYFASGEYAERWQWLSEHFTPDAVRGGALARLAGEAHQRKKTRPFDAAFLAEIEQWRVELARDIVMGNPRISAGELAYAVQATIDRIIFLRIAEARGLEARGVLDQLALAPSNLYGRLVEVFGRADVRYNSGLFHFRKEKDRATPDDLTLNLRIGDEVLRRILGRLSVDRSPYEFSHVPADILGQVYEQFLGKTVLIGQDGTARIEEKPEVRKAGGIYYTPSFVVGYIVRTTLEPLLEEATLAQVEKLRIVDPACGSGSFLIAAYQYLLDWHLEKYSANPQRHRAELSTTADGRRRLSTQARKRILLNNIFGVDLDPQAVEVAKLSLLLKVIEGETQLAFNVERLLPDLDDNIVRGNALIASDIQVAHDLTPEQREALSPFDWDKAFPEVFAAGGFDAVIGNPPYLSVDDTWGRGDVRLAYIKQAYREVYNDKTDLLFYFLKRAVDLSKGEVSFIVSRAFLEAYKADRLRGWLGENVRVREVLDFQNATVFQGVGITTGIIRLTTQKTGPATFRRFLRQELPLGMNADRLSEEGLFETLKVEQSAFGAEPWTFAETGTQDLLDRIDRQGEPVGTILHIGQGMQTGANQVFGRRTPDEIKEWSVPRGQWFIRARNSDIERYHIEDSGERILYLEDAEAFSSLPKGVQAHLREHEEALKGRAAYQRGNCEWWKFTWPLHKQHAHRRKILCPYLAAENRFAIDEQKRFLGLTDTTVLYDSDQPEELRYIVGVLNSRLLTFRFRYIGKLKSGNVREYFENTVSRLPIPRLAASDPRHGRVVDLVDQATSLAQRRAAARTPPERTSLERQLETVERNIDGEVYALFGITAEEQSHIERALGSSR